MIGGESAHSVRGTSSSGLHLAISPAVYRISRAIEFRISSEHGLTYKVARGARWRGVQQLTCHHRDCQSERLLHLHHYTWLIDLSHPCTGGDFDFRLIYRRYLHTICISYTRVIWPHSLRLSDVMYDVELYGEMISEKGIECWVRMVYFNILYRFNIQRNLAKNC